MITAATDITWGWDLHGCLGIPWRSHLERYQIVELSITVTVYVDQHDCIVFAKWPQHDYLFSSTPCQTHGCYLGSKVLSSVSGLGFLSLLTIYQMLHEQISANA